MKILLIVILFSYHFPAFSESVGTSDKGKGETLILRLQRLYPDQQPEFLEERVKLALAESAFQTWRSFPPYFYDIVRRHPQKVFSNRKGFCAGDAHVENFGFIQIKNSDGVMPGFSINDLDDAGKCRQDIDVMRLYIGHKLASTGMNTTEFIRAYQDGLEGKECKEPDYIRKLRITENARMMKSGFENGCPVSEADGVSPVEKSGDLEKRLKQFHLEKSCGVPGTAGKVLEEISEGDFQFACKQTKKTGGSAGETRYTIVLKNKLGVMSAYELKPLVKTAFDRGFGKGDSRHRDHDFNSAASHFFGPEAKEHYRAMTFTNEEGQERLYQKRPLWEGNKGVKLSKIKPDDQKDLVMKFETCVLGQIHGKGKKPRKNGFSPDPAAWDRSAEDILNVFKLEFGLP